MKPLLFAAVAFSALAFTINTPNLKPISLENSAATSWENTLTISEETFNSLSNTYQPFDQKQTKGGAIAKSDILAIITDMPSAKSIITMRFCTDPGTGFISLILKGDRTSPFNGVEYRRNTGSSDAFCPVNCNMPSNLNNVSAEIHKADYDQLTSAFSTQYSEKTMGGRINKDAMLALVNSLPETQNVVHFRFCTDAGKTSVMFMGGTLGQPENKKLCLRNGGSEAAFCPSICD